MEGFSRYLEPLDLPNVEKQRVETATRTWADLHAFLDSHLVSSAAPKPRRIRVPPVKLTLSLRNNLLHHGRRAHNTLAAPVKAAAWERTVQQRRRIMFALTAATTAGILWLSAYILGMEQIPRAVIDVYLVIYGLMTWFLVANFYKFIIGTWYALRGATHDRRHPANSARAPCAGTKVAIIYPVYHEPVARVAAGMAATWESLVHEDPEHARLFDNFLLSDSRRTSYALAEECAVHELARRFPAARFFYRHRLVNTHAKIGNVTDFCRRWGDQYDYMIVMDADSVMDGKTIMALLRMMEGSPRVGIIQTNPRPVMRRTLFGRMQQFAACLYGSVFVYSLQAMLMGHACYIGHNAIIRMKPFIEHCILPSLPGRPPWSGKPMSHDIVESVMMGRAGYEVWFVTDLQGSYEEIPANLQTFMVRERRWMQGNMQHLWFLFVNGVRPSHRETLFTGLAGYISAPLWAAFLVVSTYGMLYFLRHGLTVIGAVGMIEGPAIMLLASSLVLLFLPRLIALLVNIEHTRARGFGGKDKLVVSMLAETVFSLFFSPILMLCLTWFMWAWARHKSVSWATQERGDDCLTWSDCLRYFGKMSLLGIVCWVALYLALRGASTGLALISSVLSTEAVSPLTAMLWFIPILGGAAGSVLIARITSFRMPWLRHARLFCIPEEIEVPRVISRTGTLTCDLEGILPNAEDPETVLSHVCADPVFYLAHRPLTRCRPRVARRLKPLIESGQALSERDIRAALTERACFDALHMRAQNAKAPAPAAVDRATACAA